MKNKKNIDKKKQLLDKVKLMKQSQIDRFKNNEFVSGPISFGYKYNKKLKKIVINKKESPIVKEAYRLRNIGISIMKITAIINKKYDVIMTSPRVRKMFKDTIYFGIKKHTYLGVTKYLKVPAMLGPSWKKLSEADFNVTISS